jgi:hypothetical protein
MKVLWYSRAQCGIPPAPMAKLTPRPVRVVGTTPHHTATADHDAHPLDTWRRIYEESISGGLAEHYIDTPYNAGVAKLAPGVGVVLDGRPNSVIGAHARPIKAGAPTSWAAAANLYTLGVALVGSDPTPEAWAALKAYLFVANAIGAPFVIPHSSWDPTACPGAGVLMELSSLHSPYVILRKL